MNSSPQSTRRNPCPPLPAIQILKRPEEVAYDIKTFPIERSKTLKIAPKYELFLCTLKRIEALFITLKQIDSDTSPKSALLNVNASDDTVRKTVIQLENEFKQPVTVNKASIPFLTAHYVEVLQKPNPSFPDAVYYCTICSYHLSSIAHARTHMESSLHLEEDQRLHAKTEILSNMPAPKSNHLESVNDILLQLLADSYEKVDEKHSKLHQFFKDEGRNIQRLVQEELGGSKIIFKLYGSVKVGCDIKASNVNILLDKPDVDIACSVNILKQLYLKIYSYKNDNVTISDTRICTNVSPKISFLYNNIPVVLNWKNYDSYNSSFLIRYFCLMCPNLSSFLRMVRAWAKITGIDNSDKSRPGLSRYGFDLMCIHYLQRKGYVPYLSDVLLDRIPDNSPDNFESYKDFVLGGCLPPLKKSNAFKLRDKWNFAQLFIGFLKYTVGNQTDVVQIMNKTPLLRKDTSLKRTIFQILDPIKQENIACFSKAFQYYFLNCFLKSYIYFSVPRDENGPIADILLYQKMAESPRKNRSRNAPPKTQSKLESDKQSTPQDSKSPIKNAVRSLNTSIPLPLKAIPDPLDTNTDEENKLIENVQDMMKAFGFKSYPLKNIPKTDPNNDYKYGRQEVMDLQSTNTHISLQFKDYLLKLDIYMPFFCEASKENVQKDFTSPASPPSPSEIPQFVLPNTAAVDEYEEESDINQSACSIDQSLLSDITESTNQKICFEEFHIRYNLFQITKIGAKCSKWSKDLYVYSFDQPNNFNNGFIPEIKCSLCDEMDHNSESCPTTQMPPLVVYPPRSKFVLDELTKLIILNYNHTKLSDKNLRDARAVLDDIAEMISRTFGRPFRLVLFGSLVNGFGSRGSDMDVCFMFDEDVPPPDFLAPKVIRKISNALAHKKTISRLICIMTAKVPIVKFVYRVPYFEIETDISYYNNLALVNTELLRTYCEWEPERLPQLGLWVKKWAKVCDIGDASRGSLSSYSYIIMVIHYLQNCQPPVLPRLQEEFKENIDESVMLQEHDVYFHKKLVPKWTRNKCSVAELFLGFLDYFSSFDYESQVIQIRRKKILLKMEKGWNRPICLEDPFDLNHNLGSGVGTRMFMHIRRCFINSRRVFNIDEYRFAFFQQFNIPPSTVLNKPLLVELMIFLLQLCNIGDSPNDRQCRFCSKVGHFYEACPIRKARKRPTKKNTGQQPAKPPTNLLLRT